MTQSGSQAGRSRVRRPRKVRVGFVTWTIHYLSPGAWSRDDRLDDANAGETHAASHEIFIVTEHPTGKCDEDMLREVTVHELLHAVLETNTMNTTLKKLKRDDIEEAVVASMAPVLLQVLRDNKSLSRWLFSG